MLAGVQNSFRVLFISGIAGDTRRYRCAHPKEQLMMKGVTVNIREDDDPQLLADVFDYDLFVFHRVPFSPLIDLVIKMAHLQGKPIIFETDDLIFDPELYDHIGFVDTLSTEEAYHFWFELKQLEKTFQHCDCVLTTNEFLADQAREKDKPAYIHRNAPSMEMFHLAEQALAERQARLENNDGDLVPPVVIAYFSGTGSHNRDFQTIVEPLIRIMSSYPQTWLHVGGHLELDPDFSLFQDRIRRAPYVTWRELPQFIAQTDINVVPLELDNPFCQAKSEIKFIEAALIGVPTVASRIKAYEHAIDQGQNGILVDTSDDWYDALEHLINSPERRYEIGERARHSVYLHYTPQRQAEKLASVLRSILQNYSRSSVSNSDLWQSYISNVMQYASDLRQKAQDQDKQIEGIRQALRHYERQLIVAQRRIVSLEQNIEAIRQGRVMRMMTAVQSWWRRITGRADNDL